MRFGPEHGQEGVSAMARNYRIISGDSHLQIASERWTHRVPAKYRDQAPHTIRMPDGTDGTVAGEGSRTQVFSQGGLVGLPYSNRSPIGGRFETAPGAGSNEQRLLEQDMDGVDGEILFNNFNGPNFFKVDDHDAYLAVNHAWNEFMVEEYCAIAPERLMVMGMLPDTGVQDAIDEMEYCARAGFKGVFLYKFPNGTEMPAPEDDRFWAAALDLDIPLTAHVALGFGGRATPFPHKRDLKEVTNGVDPFQKFTQYAVRGAGTALQMVFTGLFERFPKLHFYFAETQVGWIPHFLDMLDDQYDRYIDIAERYTDIKRLKDYRYPSECIQDHFWWGFIRNASGVRARHEIGLSHMMWSTDFPHAESDWPEAQKVITEIFAGVPDDECRQMLGGNVIDYFHLDPELPIQSEARRAAIAADKS